jgi:solute carrier family 25 oxoglutarate transporter 11
MSQEAFLHTDPVPPKKKTSTRILDAILPFALGGCSGLIATCFIQPIDMIKVRIQIKNEELYKIKAEGKPNVSPSVVAREIYASGGAKAFYKGFLI